MTEADRLMLRARVKKAEALRLALYPDSEGYLTIGSDVRPSPAMNDRMDTRVTDAVFGCETIHRYDSAHIFGANRSHRSFRQLCDSAARFAESAWLKSCAIGVMHLLAHVRKLKITDVIVSSVAVFVIDGQSVRNWADEMRCYQAMNKILTSLRVAPKRYTYLLREGMNILSDYARLAPNTRETSYRPAFVDFIGAFVALNRLPHTSILPLKGRLE